MEEFNLKQWLIETKSGVYSKSLSKEAFGGYEKGSVDTGMIQNRGDLEEVNPQSLGAQQDAADAEMQKKDDQNGDWVDNASMDVVAEEPNESGIVGWVNKTKPAETGLVKYLSDLDRHDFHYKSARDLKTLDGGERFKAELKRLYADLNPAERQKAFDAFIEKSEKYFPANRNPELEKLRRLMTTDTFRGAF